MKYKITITVTSDALPPMYIIPADSELKKISNKPCHMIEKVETVKMKPILNYEREIEISNIGELINYVEDLT
jgi:hypothetical protein